jgi:hypothetical protein
MSLCPVYMNLWCPTSTLCVAEHDTRLLIGPYILMPFSILLSMPLNEKWALALLTINLLILVLMVSVSAIPASIDLFRTLVYTLASPMASLIIFGGLIVSIFNSKKKDIVNWKGRQCVVQTYK